MLANLKQGMHGPQTRGLGTNYYVEGWSKLLVKSHPSEEITSLLAGSKALTSCVRGELGESHHHSDQCEEKAPNTHNEPT